MKQGVFVKTEWGSDTYPKGDTWNYSSNSGNILRIADNSDTTIAVYKEWLAVGYYDYEEEVKEDCCCKCKS